MNETCLATLWEQFELVSRLSPVSEMGYSVTALKDVLDEEEIPCSKRLFFSVFTSFLEAKNNKFFQAKKRAMSKK